MKVAEILYIMIVLIGTLVILLPLLTSVLFKMGYKSKSTITICGIIFALIIYQECNLPFRVITCTLIFMLGAIISAGCYDVFVFNKLKGITKTLNDYLHKKTK